MIQLDSKSGLPVSDQIVLSITRLCRLGGLNPGDKLPSVRSLASQLSVNPNTVQKAYGIMELKGLIYSEPGKGSFIASVGNVRSAWMQEAEESFQKAVTAARDAGLHENTLLELVQKAYLEEPDGKENDQ